MVKELTEHGWKRIIAKQDYEDGNPRKLEKKGMDRLDEIHQKLKSGEENVYAYVYCDRCGSFSLESLTRPYTKKQNITKTMIAFGTPCLAGLAWIFVKSWVAVIVVCAIGLVIFKSIVQVGYLKCKKCGNEHITNANVLWYPPNDESILDIPSEQIVKEYVYSLIPAM